MIILSIVLDQFLFRKNHPMDRIDHILRWTIRMAFVVLFLTLPDLCEYVVAEEDPGVDFFNACSSGDSDFITKALEGHQEWVNAYTTNGESCLHLTGIFGHADVTKILLEKGADPNIRSTYEKGLRMHPLSWNVYGGHLNNIKLLLEHGADINLDFDSMKGNNAIVTSLDVLLELVKNEAGDERFIAIKKIFEQHEAKTMKQIQKEQERKEDLL
mmetsp:Transcript_4972/g.12769  ORF Transcript_4972/g.12769 Transcript_4972/m.12769 type:complete len:214 (-) Transcript_4972:724-1365(-)